MAKYTTSVIIPTSGPRLSRMLPRTLESLSNERLPESLEEIIVVENGEMAGASTICEEFIGKLPIKYYYDPYANVSNARNLGASKSTSDMLIFFDDDIRLTGSTLYSYSDAFDKFGLNHFYGGPVDIDYELQPNSDFLPFYPPSAKGFAIGNKIEVMESFAPEHFFLGANHAIPRQLFIEMNGYDLLSPNGLNAGFLGEETRIQRHMLANGTSGIYLPNAKVWHFVPTEALTRDWLMARHYRTGLTYGALMALKQENIATINNIPRYAIKRYIGNTLLRFFGAIRQASTHDRISLELERKKLLGEIAGYRQTRLEKKGGQN